MGDDICGLRGCGGSAYKAWNASLTSGSSLYGSSSTESWKNPSGANFQCAVSKDVRRFGSCMTFECNTDFWRIN